MITRSTLNNAELGKAHPHGVPGLNRKVSVLSKYFIICTILRGIKFYIVHLPSWAIPDSKVDVNICDLVNTANQCDTLDSATVQRMFNSQRLARASLSEEVQQSFPFKVANIHNTHTLAHNCTLANYDLYGSISLIRKSSHQPQSLAASS